MQNERLDCCRLKEWRVSQYLRTSRVEKRGVRGKINLVEIRICCRRTGKSHPSRGLVPIRKCRRQTVQFGATTGGAAYLFENTVNV
jgi:hypothetical protein